MGVCMHVCVHAHARMHVCLVYCSDDKNWGLETSKYALSGEEMQI